MPKDWEMVTISDVVDDLKSGLSRKLSSADIGLPVLRSTNINEHGIDLADIKYWYQDDPQGANTSNYLLMPGDILINFINSISQIGKAALYRGELQRDCIYTTNILRLRTNNRILPEYLLALTQTEQYLLYIQSITKPAINQASFTTVDFKAFEFPLPPLSEQQRIAEILGAWDEAIALTGRLIDALKRRKQGLMQRLLIGRVRFPEFEGQEWTEEVIGRLAELTAGGTPSTTVPEYWGGDIRWMKSGDIHLRRIYEVEGRITQAGLDNSSAKLLPMNSVLIALAGQGKTRGTVAINKVELATNQSVAAIMPNPEVLDYEYLYSVLDQRYEELRRLSAGDGGRGGLNLQILYDVSIALPSVGEQHKIAEVLAICDSEIEIWEAFECQLGVQKKGLMQRLLTGQIRVGV